MPTSSNSEEITPAAVVVQPATAEPPGGKILKTLATDQQTTPTIRLAIGLQRSTLSRAVNPQGNRKSHYFIFRNRSGIFITLKGKESLYRSPF